jgi:hypothetical protein
MDVYSFPRCRALHRLFLALWDKAVGTPGYQRGEWEDVWQGVAELAEKGLGLPEGMEPEEQTLVLRPPRFVQVVESSTDGMTWKEVLRAPLGTPFECDDVCGEGDKYYRIYVSERGSTSPGARNGTIGEKS